MFKAKKLKEYEKGAIAFVLGGLTLGAVFYFFGNLPGIKQAQMGLNGASQPLLPNV